MPKYKYLVLHKNEPKGIYDTEWAALYAGSRGLVTDAGPTIYYAWRVARVPYHE